MTDLHLHTTASDGALDPAELVRRAAWAGVRLLSVTDHDTTAALAAAEAEARSVGIEFIPGIELSVTAAGEAIHLLAYGFDPLEEALAGWVDGFRADRHRRMDAMVDRLAAHGVLVPPDVLEAVVGEGNPGRMHLAAAVVRCGGASSIREAFDRYLADARPCHVPLPDRPAGQAIGLVHGAGGIAVLAHPGEWMSHRAVTALVAAGLDGLEVWHPSHDVRLSDYYLELADRFGLVATGGSDYHAEGGAEPGSYAMPEHRVSVLRERLRRARRSAGRFD